MPKRSHADFAGDRQAYQGDGPSKRNLPTSLHVSKGTNTSGNDLDLLVQHADELIDCLRSLKAQNKQDAAGYSTPAFSSPDIERRLAVLSPKVLPAFRNLAEAAGLGQADELSRSVRDQHVCQLFVRYFSSEANLPSIKIGWPHPHCRPTAPWLSLLRVTSHLNLRKQPSVFRYPLSSQLQHGSCPTFLLRFHHYQQS